MPQPDAANGLSTARLLAGRRRAVGAFDIAGRASLTPAIELAGTFHQAVFDDHIALNATLTRLQEQTSAEDHAYFVDIAHFMAGLPLPAHHSTPQWPDGEQATRERWHALVTARRHRLGISQ